MVIENWINICQRRGCSLAILTLLPTGVFNSVSQTRFILTEPWSLTYFWKKLTSAAIKWWLLSLSSDSFDFRFVLSVVNQNEIFTISCFIYWFRPFNPASRTSKERINLFRQRRDGIGSRETPSWQRRGSTMIHRGGTTWTVMAVCLADNFAGNVPSSAVRLALNEAGLGQKKNNHISWWW